MVSLRSEFLPNMTRPFPRQKATVWNLAGNLGEATLLQEASSCIETLHSVILQHQSAEQSMSAGNPHGAVAGAECGLKQLDSCLPYSRVSLRDVRRVTWKMQEPPRCKTTSCIALLRM